MHAECGASGWPAGPYGTPVVGGNKGGRSRGEGSQGEGVHKESVDERDKGSCKQSAVNLAEAMGLSGATCVRRQGGRGGRQDKEVHRLNSTQERGSSEKDAVCLTRDVWAKAAARLQHCTPRKAMLTSSLRLLRACLPTRTTLTQPSKHHCNHFNKPFPTSLTLAVQDKLVRLTLAGMQAQAQRVTTKPPM